MVEELGGTQRITLGAKKAYDTAGFVAAMRWRRVPPDVARNDTHRRSAIDGRTTHHPGYAVSRRKRIEEVLSWMNEDCGRDAQDPSSRHHAGWLDVHLERCRLNPGTDAETAGCCSIARPGFCPKWPHRHNSRRQSRRISQHQPPNSRQDT